jgi:hypothetical protein
MASWNTSLFLTDRSSDRKEMWDEDDENILELDVVELDGCCDGCVWR